MNRRRRALALGVLLVVLAGCASASSTDGSRSGSAARVRCLTDPSRDDSSTTRPLFFLFCMESP